MTIEICHVCDLPIVWAETSNRDDDEVCRRYKPYCTNRHNAVDWRARALRAESQLVAMTAARDEACDLAEDGSAYAGEYFREKWQCAESIAALRKVGR